MKDKVANLFDVLVDAIITVWEFALMVEWWLVWPLRTFFLPPTPPGVTVEVVHHRFHRFRCRTPVVSLGTTTMTGGYGRLRIVAYRQARHMAWDLFYKDTDKMVYKQTHRLWEIRAKEL